jgi:chromosome segregation ATPase
MPRAGREALAAKITGRDDAQAQRDVLQDALQRAESELHEIATQQLEARAELAEAQHPGNVVASYLSNTVVLRHDAAAIEARLDSLHRAYADHTQICEALQSELTAAERQVERAQHAVTAAVAAVVEQSAEFQALLAAWPAAWHRLRSLKTTFDAIAKLTSGQLSGETFSLFNRSEPIEERVGYPVDESLASSWQSAVEGLANDAETPLPNCHSNGSLGQRLMRPT